MEVGYYSEGSLLCISEYSPMRLLGMVWDIVDWLIVFNGISTRLRLFYTEMLGIIVPWKALFTFWVIIYLRVIGIYKVFRSNLNNVHTVLYFKYFYLVLIIIWF